MVFLCQKTFNVQFTDFLQINKANEILDILKKEHGKFYFSMFGGIEGTKRVQIAISPLDNISENNFPITPLQINFKNMENVSHRNILGSILSLGIDRYKIGDILIFNENVVVFLDNDIFDFVYVRLSSVGKNRVNTSLANKEMLFIPLENYKEIQIKIDDFRLSKLISKCFNISRSESQKLVESSKVYINNSSQYKDKINFELLKNDMEISIRGFGKLILKYVQNKSATFHIYK
ncbi:MAG: YlmH/Sll1252 family protein [Defluviitaleaceae bacterium]|nr:YlmH/Sll1252 family protein [Defluviitaleaceae bacterium]